VYIYNDGIVRFATESKNDLISEFEKPNEENLDNLYSHLTNYAINKANTNFKVDDLNLNEGHKRLITSVFKNEEYEVLMSKISKIVLKTIISGLPCMQNALGQCKKNDPSACFQLLGFDIILT
jgi:tubulin polyglutamylase TTLL6/13